MNDDERSAAIAILRERWADAIGRRERLAAEIKSFGEWIGPIREAFGNPYFYSGGKHGRPENAEQSASKYTGYKSHAVVRDTIGPALVRLEALRTEMTAIREQLHELGATP